MAETETDPFVLARTIAWAVKEPAVTEPKISVRRSTLERLQVRVGQLSPT